MKLLSLAALATVATSAIAQPHKPHHRHPHPIAKRAPNGAVYQPGPVETVIVYVLNGQPISEDEVNQGINNGTLIWADDDNLTSVAALPTQPPPPPSVQPSPEPAPPTNTGAPVPEPESNSKPEPPKQSEQAPQPQPQPEQNQYGPSNPSSSYEGIDKEFPSGTFGCDSFPKGYGATPVDHAGLGGWIGIQDPGVANAAGFDDIKTVPHGSCSDGTCCTPGAFCSYSCPPGYLKSSWPEKQGITKQSIGGLYCNPSNSKLELASGAIAKTLCVKGTDQVTIKVRNKLSVSESICRTDYPGKPPCNATSLTHYINPRQVLNPKLSLLLRVPIRSLNSPVRTTAATTSGTASLPPPNITLTPRALQRKTHASGVTEAILAIGLQ